MTVPSLLWAAIAVGWLLVDGTAGANISSSVAPGRDKQIYKKNMQSFLGHQRQSPANASTVPPTPPGDRELALLARIVHDIRQLNATIQRANATVVDAAQERQMRAIYRQVKRLANSTSGGRTRHARLLIKALSVLAGAKLGTYMAGKKSGASGSVTASDSLDWLGKIFNLAITVTYGGANATNGNYNAYYGPACNDNTWPDCSTGATPCNANGLPACYFNWPLCNSNVYPVCSTVSGTPCNNNGLPYCVDIGVPCNANTLGYCLNGPPPCNDNNWPFCPGYGLAVAPFAGAANPNVNAAGVVNVNGNAGTSTLVLGNRLGALPNTQSTSLNGNVGNVNTRPTAQVGNKILGNANTRPTSVSSIAGNVNTRPTSSNGNAGNFNTRPNSLVGNKVGNVNTRPTSSNGNAGNFNTRPNSLVGNKVGNINTRPTSSNGNAGNFNTRPSSLVGNKVGNSNTRPTPFNGNGQGNTNSQPWATIANNMADTNMADSNMAGDTNMESLDDNGNVDNGNTNTNTEPWASSANNINGNMGNTNVQPWANNGNNNGDMGDNIGNLGNTNTEPWANTAINNNNGNIGAMNPQAWPNNGNAENTNTQPWASNANVGNANNGNSGNTDTSAWATMADADSGLSPLAGVLGNTVATRPSGGNTNTRPSADNASLMPRPPPPAFVEQESPRPGDEAPGEAPVTDIADQSQPPVGKPQRIQGLFSRPNRRKPSDVFNVSETTSRPETIALRPSTDKKKKKQPTTTTTTTTGSPSEPSVQTEEESGVEEGVPTKEEIQEEEEVPGEGVAQNEEEVEEVIEEEAGDAASYDTTIATGPYIDIDIVTSTEAPEPEDERYPDAGQDDDDKKGVPAGDAINVQSLWSPALNSEHPSAPIIDGAFDDDDVDGQLWRAVEQPPRQEANTKVNHANRRATQGDNHSKPASNGIKRPSNRIKRPSNRIKHTSTKQSSNAINGTTNKINQSSHSINHSSQNARKKIKYVRKKVKVDVQKKVEGDNTLLQFVDEKEINFAKPANDRSRLLYGLPAKFHSLAKISTMSVGERNTTTVRGAHRPSTQG